MHDPNRASRIAQASSRCAAICVFFTELVLSTYTVNIAAKPETLRPRPYKPYTLNRKLLNPRPWTRSVRGPLAYLTPNPGEPCLPNANPRRALTLSLPNAFLGEPSKP